MESLSVCIVTKNEAHNIVACLESIAWANEIIVLDAESTDTTVALCKRYTNKVFVTPWPGCGPQKKKAFDLATSDWVLILDADERVTPKLAAEIKQVLQNPTCNGYEIPFQSYYCGKRIRFGDWYNEKHLRLIRRKHSDIIPRLIHFGVKVEGRVEKLKHHIDHYSFPTVTSVINKMHSYSTDGALHQFQAGKRTSFASAVGHGLFTFVRGYILRCGFLDGRQGLMLAISNAEGSYYKYLKLLDLQIKDQHHQQNR